MSHVIKSCILHLCELTYDRSAAHSHRLITAVAFRYFVLLLFFFSIFFLAVAECPTLSETPVFFRTCAVTSVVNYVLVSTGQCP